MVEVLLMLGMGVEMADQRGILAGGGGGRSFREPRDWYPVQEGANIPPRFNRQADSGKEERNFAGLKRLGEHGEGRDVRQMTDLDLRHKLNKDHEDRRRTQPQQPFRCPGLDQVQETGSNQNQGMLCYNYHQSGHHRSQCLNPSFCYGCKQSGHISSKCPNAKANKGLKLCGFGMPGQLFYSLNIPEEKGPETVEFGKQLRAIVTVTEGRGTRFRVSEELNYLVGS